MRLCNHHGMLSRIHPSWLCALLASLALLCLGSCKSDDAKSPYEAKDVAWISMRYPGWGMMDAAVPQTTVKVDGSGRATCSRRLDGGFHTGQLPEPDTVIPDLLSRPGVVRDLATVCPLQVKDAGPYITTQFANDADGTDHDRLVWSSCSTADLESLVQALVRIGDACIATVSTQVDAGSSASAPAPPFRSSPTLPSHRRAASAW